MMRRYNIFSLVFILIALFGLSGCTRERTPWPEESVQQMLPPTSTPTVTPTATLTPIILPQFTPHVTPVRSPTTVTPAQPPTVTPQPAQATIAAPLAPVEHIVQPGETLFDIAQHYGIAIEALAEANSIVDPTRVKPGDKIEIPIH
ncbi:MAG: hypothetical protein DSY55_05440 [Clostridia bacterium]|nr:MAG: hypothetical protein DSY55_05440 [Clostridia bacterium]